MTAWRTKSSLSRCCLCIQASLRNSSSPFIRTCSGTRLVISSLMRGHDTRSIQQYLGRRNIMHTMRYTELSPEQFKGFWKD
jgi:hypothetical protein